MAIGLGPQIAIQRPFWSDHAVDFADVFLNAPSAFSAASDCGVPSSVHKSGGCHYNPASPMSRSVVIHKDCTQDYSDLSDPHTTM